jgi:hypothetical protein
MSFSSFSELVRAPFFAPKKASEKFLQMEALIPEFEIGVSNGRSIAFMCKWLSENSDDFKGMSPDKIDRLYRYVRDCGKDKTATRAKPSKAAKPAPAPIPLPASAAAPPQSVVQKAPPPAQPPSNMSTPAQVSDYRKAGEAAKERLKALGEEAADWAEPQGFFLSRQDNDAMSEWMRLEPGRMEMITELVRAALRSIESAKAGDLEYPDWFICNSYLGKGYSHRAMTAKRRASKERAEAQQSPALKIFS